MKATVDPGALRTTRLSDHAIRFAFGGVVTVCTGIVAGRFGAEIGGLFLAFPAVLPASLTLLERRHDSATTANDAFGSIFGSLGLVAFAALAARLIEHHPAGTLPAATLAWAAVAMGAWWCYDGWQSRRRIRGHAARRRSGDR